MCGNIEEEFNIVAFIKTLNIHIRNVRKFQRSCWFIGIDIFYY